MPLLDYTTSVPVARTISQIQAILVEHGARSVMMQYDDRGRINALVFQVSTPSGEVPIRMPINASATHKVLQRQSAKHEIPRRFADEEHAYRVAWRIVKDWVEAQMSLLDTEMVQMDEIFLPYIVTRSGQTVYQIVAERHFMLELKPGSNEM